MKEFKFKIDGNSYNVAIEEVSKDVASVEVNGRKFTVNIEKQEKPVVVAAPRPAAPAAAPKASAAPAPKAPVAGSVTSPLPGSIVKVLASEGQAVKRGDTILTIESMKMENNIKTDRDGVIKTIFVKPGQSVMQGDPLFDYE